MATAPEITQESNQNERQDEVSEKLQLMTLDGKQKFMCDLCDKYENVNYRCMECSQNLCDACNKIHSRTKPAIGHSVVDINLWDTFQEEVTCNLHAKCPEHPGKVYHLNLFCTNCMQLVCGACRRSLRNPVNFVPPPCDDLPNLSPEERKLQELYLQLEYYKEVERLILQDQGIDTSKRANEPMMADKVKEFMRLFTYRIDKVRREMIEEVNTNYEGEEKVSLDYTYREKIDALEDKIENYNKKLFDHTKSSYLKAAEDAGVDLPSDAYKPTRLFRGSKREKTEDNSEVDYDKTAQEEDASKGDDTEIEEKPEAPNEKPKRRCRSPVFEPGEVDEEKIKAMVQDYILQGETPDLIARQEALIREMFGKLEYEIIEEKDDGSQEVAKVTNLGRDIKTESQEETGKGNGSNLRRGSKNENQENLRSSESTENDKDGSESRPLGNNGVD